MPSWITKPVSSLRGQYLPPGDKSISHRAVMLGAIASGTSQFSNFLPSDDCLRTVEAFRQMGVPIQLNGNDLRIEGVGFKGLKKPSCPLDMGNSGTGIRLLLGLLAGQLFEATLTGDASLSKRPMGRLTKPLREMGAFISGADDANFAPLQIKGASLKGIHFINEKRSAQVKSAILLAGLQAKGKTVIEESPRSRNHTEHMLTMMGAHLSVTAKQIVLKPAEKLKPLHFAIPGDISSAAFLIAAAALLPGSDLTVKEVGLNETRIGVLEILRLMGAGIEWQFKHHKGEEPAGDVRIRGAQLKSVVIEKEMIPKLIDELPVLMIACALAKGKSIVRDAAELRVKETDRIHAMVEGLNAIGGKAVATADGCVITGVSDFQGGKIKSYDDHRVVMSFAVAGLKSRVPIRIDETRSIETSYPAFFDDLTRLTGV